MSGLPAVVDLVDTAERALHALHEHWKANNTSATIDEWTLRVHMGALSRNAPPPPATLFNNVKMFFTVRDNMFTFLDDVPAELFLRTFQRLIGKATHKADVITTSTFTDAAVCLSKAPTRTLANDTACRLKADQTVAPTVHLERAISHKQRVAFDACIAPQVSGDNIACQCAGDVRHERRQTRSVVFHAESLWRIDFTRVDDGKQHRIELQLMFTTAYARCKRQYDALREKDVLFDEFLLRVCTLQLSALVVRLNCAALGARL